MKTPFVVVMSMEPFTRVNGASILEMALIELVREARDPWEFSVCVRLLIDAWWETTVLERSPNDPSGSKVLVRRSIDACC